MAGNCLVVRRLDLAPGEIPNRSPVLRFEIAAWARDPLLGPVLLEMYEAAYGHHAAAHDASWLEDRLEDAFYAGSLVAIREDRQGAYRAGGGGGAARAPASGPASSSRQPATPPEAPRRIEKTWFRARLVDEDGLPMSGEDYTLVDTDGAKRKGKLDANGEVYIPPILPPGKCTIGFPNIHLNPRKKK